MKKGSLKNKVVACVLTCAMVLGMAGCGKSASKTESGSTAIDTKNTIVYGSNDYTRINPAMDEHGEINALIFDGLTDHDGDNQVIPRLAKSWELDEATNTYTFHLEENVKWHDG